MSNHVTNTTRRLLPSYPSPQQQRHNFDHAHPHLTTITLIPINMNREEEEKRARWFIRSLKLLNILRGDERIETLDLTFVFNNYAYLSSSCFLTFPSSNIRPRFSDRSHVISCLPKPVAASKQVMHITQTQMYKPS